MPLTPPIIRFTQVARIAPFSPLSQIIPPHDEGIAAAILEELEPWLLDPILLLDGEGTSSEAATGRRQWDDPTAVVSREYYRRLSQLCYRWVRAAMGRGAGVGVSQSV